MLTGRQIRAARALLEWNAEDLAKKTGVSRVTISNIEAETVQPQEKTLKSILNVFDKYGVDFTDDEGVRIRKNEVRFFSGKAGFRQLLDHMYETLKDNGGKLYQYTSDNHYLSYAEDYVNTHIDRMNSIKGLDARVLMLEGDTDFLGDFCAYRWIDKSYAAVAPFCVYGEYVVMVLHEAAYKKEFMSVRSKLLAERYNDEFLFYWNKGSTPKAKAKKQA